MARPLVWLFQALLCGHVVAASTLDDLDGPNGVRGSRPKAGELHSDTLWLRLCDGVVTGLSNRLTGERLVVAPRAGSLPAGLRRLGEPFLRVRQAEERRGSNWLVQTLAWPDAGRFELRAEVEATSGDLLLTQVGQATGRRLVGISWSLADIPDRFEVLVPGCSGQRFSAEAPAGQRAFDYPTLWEASFVLLQGRDGGVLIRADDPLPRYKTLLVEHAHGTLRLRFESRNEAPWEDRDRIESTRWRLTAYRGPWQVGAGLYRNWIAAQRGWVPLERQQPAWVRDIQFVVTMNLERPSLAQLARHCRPEQTLLYLPDWRRDGYDRNYPDYTASTNFDAFVTEAHRLGFRVMVHVNHFGCDPKHPLYAQFQAVHMRDPFTRQLLWWEWPAEPPIKFAYINPASRAWRELFVGRMKELVARHRVDALHLDQTLCIYNDANGRVDGLTCLEGNLALHRELRAALPHVALSGEGLNEITAQGEAFAQRHVWGLDHTKGTWDDALIALAHPISSAVLTPYTRLYGYLGMANPAQTALFVAWQRAYERFGVLPTYTWPTPAQLANPPPTLATLLTQARFFQAHYPGPDFDSAWESNDLFVYRLAGGGRAAFRRDYGVAFGTNASAGIEQAASFVALTRRIEGVNVAPIPGSVPGWAAYDGERLFGLDPSQAYMWSPQPRDLAALHLASLPEGVVVEQTGRHPEFARFRFREAKATDRIPLWRFGGFVLSGVRLADGATRTGDALDFEDEPSGGVVHPEGDGLFMHPPWRGPEATRGRPVTFIEFTLDLPQNTRPTFEAGVHLREGAVGKSDGVTFRVRATSGIADLSAETHHDGLDPKLLGLDLSPLAGQGVRLRLEVDAGPNSNPSFDWARFASPQIRIQGKPARHRRTVTVAGLPTNTVFLTPSGSVQPATITDGRVTLEVPVPGSLVLAHAAPAVVLLPCDLLQTKFTSHVGRADGIETPAFDYFGGTPTTARCGGVERPALGLHPPPGGRSLADYLLRLPDQPARLVTAIGLRDGSKSKGVGFSVEVNAEPQFSRSLQPSSGWVPVTVDLSRWRGQAVLLTLVTDAEGGHDFDWAVWAEPRLEAVPENR